MGKTGRWGKKKEAGGGAAPSSAAEAAPAAGALPQRKILCSLNHLRNLGQVGRAGGHSLRETNVKA